MCKISLFEILSLQIPHEAVANASIEGFCWNSNPLPSLNS
jgi:hypothetical protein